MMTMPEQTKAFLDEAAKFPPLHMLTPEEIRKAVMATAISETYELASTETLNLNGPHGPLAARLYRPSNKSSLPVILFFHGGGFVFTMRICQSEEQGWSPTSRCLRIRMKASNHPGKEENCHEPYSCPYCG